MSDLSCVKTDKLIILMHCVIVRQREIIMTNDELRFWAKEIEKKLGSHECDENVSPENDLCPSCREHAAWCSECARSNCCGTKALELN